MSLIDDALKRAQAAEPALLQRPPAWTPTHLPERRRRRGGSAIWVSVLLVVGFAAAWAGLRAGNRGPATKALAATAAPHAPALPDALAPGSQTAALAVPATPRAAATPHSIANRPLSLAGAEKPKEPAPEKVEARAPESRAALTLERSPQALLDGKSYSGEISLPTGSKIELGGIVYSDESPVALLNGHVMAPGGIVEGMTIARIDPDRVELQGHGVTVFLLLK